MYFNNKEIEKKISEYIETRNPEIINELAPVFNQLIRGVISKYKLLRRNLINDDLFQEAWVGILEAAPKWSKEKGDAFSYFTAIAKNKIFWYLKNYYQDTSYDSKEIKNVSFDEEENGTTLSLTSVDDHYVDILSIKDYIEKLTIKDLRVKRNKENEFILQYIKKKFLNGDALKYIDLVKEIQKETKIPKKKIRNIVDSIYKNFVKENENE